MKKVLVITMLIVGAFVASLFLGGCGKETVIIMPASTTIETTIATTTTESTTITVEETYVPDTDLFLKQVYKNTSFNNFMTDFELVQIGTTICKAFDRGMTLSQVASIISSISIKNDLSSEQTNDFTELTAIAVITLCPKYSHLFE